MGAFSKADLGQRDIYGSYHSGDDLVQTRKGCYRTDQDHGLLPYKDVWSPCREPTSQRTTPGR